MRVTTTIRSLGFVSALCVQYSINKYAHPVIEFNDAPRSIQHDTRELDH